MYFRSHLRAMQEETSPQRNPQDWPVEVTPKPSSRNRPSQALETHPLCSGGKNSKLSVFWLCSFCSLRNSLLESFRGDGAGRISVDFPRSLYLEAL